MGKQKITLSIEHPCIQDWDKMPSADQGKFCAQCSRTVIDFTGLTHAETEAIINTAGYDICGNFLDQQLEETYSLSTINQGLSLSKIAAGVLLLAATGAGSAKAFPPPPFTYYQADNRNDGEDTVKTTPSTGMLPPHITGIVKNRYNNPVSRLLIVCDGHATLTDSNGYFQLPVVKLIGDADYIITLKMRVEGYSSLTIRKKGHELKEPLNIQWTPEIVPLPAPEQPGNLRMRKGKVKVKRKYL